KLHQATTNDTILTVLIEAATECKKRNQKHCFVTFNQPLYFKAREIVASVDLDKDIHNVSSVIVRLSYVNIVPWFSRFIVNGSGLKEVFSLIYTETSTEKALTGHAFSRAIRGHSLVHLARGTTPKRAAMWRKHGARSLRVPHPGVYKSRTEHRQAELHEQRVDTRAEDALHLEYKSRTVGQTEPDSTSAPYALITRASKEIAGIARRAEAAATEKSRVRPLAVETNRDRAATQPEDQATEDATASVGRPSPMLHIAVLPRGISATIVTAAVHRKDHRVRTRPLKLRPVQLAGVLKPNRPPPREEYNTIAASGRPALSIPTTGKRPLPQEGPRLQLQQNPRSRSTQITTAQTTGDPLGAPRPSHESPGANESPKGLHTSLHRPVRATKDVNSYI
ncbi:uncharacterized protein, partial [Anoplolepis gracilipes]|uniref:uncharacterized protein n=1 Tax=Anoplolepis gracilipes TaxID=354296 RepID=UPI003BA30BFF